MLRYEYIGDSSRKYWEIFPVDESSYGDYVVRVHYGRIGTSGQENVKVFSYRTGAERYRNEKIAEKLKKGYKLKGATGAASGPLYSPAFVAPPKAAPACVHITLMRSGGKYVCANCKMTVEFDKPQADISTPAFQQKVRRYFDRSVTA
jgi:predicted DNA-binding WGR domain protein